MTDRAHGSAPGGARPATAVPHGHRKAITFAAALTAGGLVAPLAFGGPMTGAVFLAYVERILPPAPPPGTVAVMGNLPCHDVAGGRRAVARAGWRPDSLPPYSPDLNPVENALGQFERRLRTAAARTVEGVYAAMRDAVTHFAPAECLSDLRHGGYAPARPT